MQRSLFFLAFLILLIMSAHAGGIRRVKRAMEKADYGKAENLILKFLDGQQINPGIKYYYSVLFVTPEFPRYSLDSATLFIRQSIADYESADNDALEEMEEEEISLKTLTTHLVSIIALAFQRAKAESTIPKWDFFITSYPEAGQMTLAVDSRDSLAFQAIDKTAPPSLQNYLNDYPNSKLRSETQNILDRLLVTQFWKMKSKENLAKFVEGNPRSEYKETALRHLWKLSTVSGEINDFLSFIQKYPKTTTTTQAINFLYHLDKEQGFKNFEKYQKFHPSADSLLKIRQSESTFWFATFDQSYKLVSEKNEMISIPLTSINDDAFCDGLPSLVSGSDTNGTVILSKGGKEIVRGELIQDLGAGYLLVRQGSEQHVYHKSGARILQDVEDAEILNNRFLKIKRNKWALYTLTGISLTEHRFDNIFVDGSFWVFRKNELLAVSTSSDISSSFPEGLFLEFKFEDYELVGDDLLIGFREDRECLLQSDGEFLVPWGTHRIFPDKDNGYVHDQKGYAFYGTDGFTYYPYLEINDGFVLRKEAENGWMLFSKTDNWFIPLKDSVKLISEYCALIADSQPKLVFQNQKTVEIDTSSIPQSFSSNHSLTLIKGSESSVYNASGEMLFTGKYDQIKLLNDTLFAVSKENKHGVISSLGEEILPLEFDYLSLEGELISFISKQKIGAYDLVTKTQFEPDYESKIERLGSFYKTTKARFTGLIDQEENEILPFGYEDIIQWTDSLVWTKQDDEYRLINVNSLKSQLDVSLLTPFNAGAETLMKFYSSSGFGLISQMGIMLKPIYSEISWIGNESTGVIMADQALPDAGFHVVTYFDSNGDKIHSQAYSNEDFEKVLCDR